MRGRTNAWLPKDVTGETVFINLVTNQDSHDDLVGAGFSVSYTDYEESFTWEGTEMELSIPAKMECTIRFSEVEGYRTPDDVVFTAEKGNSREVVAEYCTELLTVNMGSVSGYEVTVSVLPKIEGTDYYQLEYIESTGTQYVDTGFKPNQDTRVVMEATCLIDGGNYFLFGARTNSSNNNANSLTYGFNAYQTKYRTHYYNGWSDYGTSISFTDKFALDKDKNVTTIGGSNTITRTYTSFQCAYSMYLFAVNTAGTAGTFGNVKLYSCQIYDNGTLVRDYVPAQDGNGIAGLYDRVNDTFSVSAGTADFVAGEYVPLAVQTEPTATYKIAYGVQYKVSGNTVTGYTTPDAIARTASQKTYGVDMTPTKEAYINLCEYDAQGNKIYLTTANCYVVRNPGAYCFNLMYGSAFYNGSANEAAYTNNGGTYSHDFVNYLGNAITAPGIEQDTGITIASAQLSIADTDGVITDLQITENDYGEKVIAFRVSTVPDTGANCIISAKDSDGVIMWNWHIWVWPYPLTPVEITNATSVSYEIMPVNLATKLDSASAVNASTGQPATTSGWKNWFYQFGRPTPLLCPSAYNSTSNHASYGTLGFTATNTATNIQMGIKNPTTHYKYSNGYNFNWFSTNSGKTYNLWDAGCSATGNGDNDVVKTVYDPCPAGFKMPNGNTFSYFSTSNAVGSLANGYKFKRYSGDTTGVFFPASGCRDGSDGSLDGVGPLGSVWLSSAYSQSNACSLYFYSDYVDPQDYNHRAYGFSVRPVKDDSIEQQII